MPKNIPVAVRLKGMELYVANSMSAREIAEHLTVNYNVSVKPPTIYAWARKYDWDTKRTEVATQTNDKIVQSEATKAFQLQDEQLKIYTDIREKAYNELVTIKAFKWEYEIVNYTAMTEGQWFTSHNHLQHDDFATVHYLNFKDDHNFTSFFKLFIFNFQVFYFILKGLL